MKKTVFLTVFGLATSVVLSHAQGYVIFSSYLANGGNGALASISGNDGRTYYSGLIGEGYTAALFYALGTVSDPSGASPAFTLYTGPNDTAAYDNSGAAIGIEGLGYFDGGVAVIPGYTGGPITFEVAAFNGFSYADSSLRVRSGSFTMNFISTASQPVVALGDNGQPMPDINIVIIPEPASLALAGLGGLVSLVMFRRKHH